MFNKSILTQALMPNNLNLAWKRLSKEHTPWSMGVSRQDLQKDLIRYLFVIKEQAETGHYRPEPLRKFTQNKANGKKRIISAQYLQDKFLQRALLTVLEPKAERIFHEDSYAYRPNRGVKQAISKVNERVRCGLTWLVDADIQGFFDNIPLAPLRKKLQSFVGDKETMELMNMWLKQGIHHGCFLTHKRGISQGAILSPLMCNLYLTSFDKALDKANIPFVRYADDFLLFTKTKKQAEIAHLFALKQLKALGLSIHPQKTQIVRSSPNIVFLGQKLPAV